MIALRRLAQSAVSALACAGFAACSPTRGAGPLSVRAAALREGVPGWGCQAASVSPAVTRSVPLRVCSGMRGKTLVAIEYDAGDTVVSLSESWRGESDWSGEVRSLAEPFVVHQDASEAWCGGRKAGQTIVSWMLPDSYVLLAQDSATATYTLSRVLGEPYCRHR